MTGGDLLSRCRNAVARAKRCGADEAEAFGETARSITVTIEKNDLQIARSQQEDMLGIRAIRSGGQGFACTNNPDGLEAACRDAVDLAKGSPADGHNVFPAIAAVSMVDGIYDPSAVEFTIEDALGETIKMLDLATEMDRRIILGDGLFSVEVGERAIVNSRGLELAERGSLFSYFVLATAKEGERVSNMDYQFDACRAVSEIDVGPITERACRNALGSLGAEKGESFNGTVLLSPNAVFSILVGLIAHQVSGKSVLRGMSRWGETLGRPVAVPALTIVDDGRAPGGVATASFDREGTAHRKTVLINEGTLETLVHNAYSAHAAGVETTGHASGSARTLPGVGPTNFEILPGAVSRDELIADTRKGLLVTRFSGTTNPISGDFSGVAKGAYLIAEGRLTRPVTGTLIAGNAFEALTGVSGISSERERVLHTTLPTLRIENASVTAG